MSLTLDLAFSLDPALPADLLQAAGPYGDPNAADEHWQGLLGGWLVQLAAELPAGLSAQAYSLGLSVCGDAEIAELNARWRQVEGPTDVLAFAAQDADLDAALPPPPPPPAGLEPEPLELGDIVISLETAARQARAAGEGLERELPWLASHGLLHLLGWDHPTEARLQAMLARQDQLLGCEHRAT